MASIQSRLLLLGVFVLYVIMAEAKRPHIVFIVADDMGWNDVGFRNPEILSPNIDKLAREGVILNQTYVQPLCSPSRSAMMSGYYPFRTGLQHLVIMDYQPVCLPLNLTILPEKMKALGYNTHIVGKWHLGFCSWNCTPTYRGFDSFLGYYNAMEDYYTHDTAGFLDYRNNTEAVRDENGTYSTITFKNRALEIIAKHNANQPLFLYLPFQNVHSPIEVPKYYENLYPNIQNEGRRKFSGMVTALDDAVGNVTAALKAYNLYNDTLIIFTADNGGWITEYGNNYPLRGGKFTIYEGGTRATAFVHGAGLQKTGYTYEGITHAVDWMPTIVAAAGGDTEPDDQMDGMNLWPSISTGQPSARTEIVYNLDDMFPYEEGHAAIRNGDWKLVEGFPGLYPNWYKPQQLKKDYPINEMNCTHQNKQIWQDKYQLFNLKDDPTEHNDLSSKYPDIVAKLKTRLDTHKAKMVPPNYPIVPDPKSNPKLFNNVWSPGWC